MSVILDRSVFVLSFLHALFVPLQGFVNAMIYGNFHKWVMKYVKTQRDTCTLQGSSSWPGTPPPERETHVHPALNAGIARLFLTTFDMSNTELPSDLVRLEAGHAFRCVEIY